MFNFLWNKSSGKREARVQSYPDRSWFFILSFNANQLYLGWMHGYERRKLNGLWLQTGWDWGPFVSSRCDLLWRFSSPFNTDMNACACHKTNEGACDASQSRIFVPIFNSILGLTGDHKPEKGQMKTKRGKGQMESGSSETWVYVYDGQFGISNSSLFS